MKARRAVAIAVMLVLLVGLGLGGCGGGSNGSPEPTDGTTPPATVSPDEGIVTQSGLRYITIVEGDGAQPSAGDIVHVDYTGTLEDGTKLGSSQDQGEPLAFRVGVGQIMPGLDEGVSLMKVGGKARLVIPPELGYGDKANGPIPANSTLIFEVELLSVDQAAIPREVADADFQVSADGLKYYDIKAGDGSSPANGDTVLLSLTLWRGDGVELQSSDYDGQLAEMTVGAGQMIKGLEEGLLPMKVGGQRQLVLPPELGFGEQEPGHGIGPNETLTIEVELVAVIPAAEAMEQTEVPSDAYTTTDSGLKYYDIAVGDGSVAEAGDNVLVHYTGWLEDGTKFDSSVDHQPPAPLSFVLGAGHVIPGWDEGVAGMRVGGKRQLVIPPELAYGEKGSGSIPANSTLIFDVELCYAY